LGEIDFYPNNASVNQKLSARLLFQIIFSSLSLESFKHYGSVY
jgi:hypothetical protein